MAKTEWDRQMAFALKAATFSPDPSTQNGALLYWPGSGRHIAAWNDFPIGVAHLPDRWERPTKYHFVEHAERAVIFKAAKAGLKTAGATMVCPWAACPDCARAIAIAGIRRLVRYPLGDQGHWAAEVEVGDTILREALVEIVEEDFETVPIPKLRRNGAVWNPLGQEAVDPQ